MRKYKKDLTTLDYLLSKISSKIDTSHLAQRMIGDIYWTKMDNIKRSCVCEVLVQTLVIGDEKSCFRSLSPLFFEHLMMHIYFLRLRKFQ